MRLTILFLACMGFSAGWTAENFTADYYQAATAKYLGKEIKLRIASVEPNNQLTQLDSDFVWIWRRC
ncbi:MAG: hypothetical protein EBV83_02965 [Verrucomicrobia bacterium]|nr:hypothetical protein [Verrucomicrobiota bacterium]